MPSDFLGICYLLQRAPEEQNRCALLFQSRSLCAMQYVLSRKGPPLNQPLLLPVTQPTCLYKPQAHFTSLLQRVAQTRHRRRDAGCLSDPHTLAFMSPFLPVLGSVSEKDSHRVVFAAELDLSVLP